MTSRMNFVLQPFPFVDMREYRGGGGRTMTMTSSAPSIEDHSGSTGVEIVELRSRNGRGGGSTANFGSGATRYEEPVPSWLGNNRVLIDRKIKPTDTINKIALQYHVSVADIKRANALVNDQDIHALPAIKIPVSRFVADRHKNQDDGGSNHQMASYLTQPDAFAAVPAAPVATASYRVPATTASTQDTFDDRAPLLADDDDYAYDQDHDSDDQRMAKVNEILSRTDQTVAQVRDNLPSPVLEGGAFHFIDATSPDNTIRNVGLLVAALITMFIIIPLILTLVEERAEAEAELHHHQAAAVAGAAATFKKIT